MLRKTILFVALAVIACQAAPDDAIINQIYNDVYIGDFLSAITKTKELDRRGKGSVITQTVNKLVDRDETVTMVFAYKLYNRDANGKDIVKRNFPIEFTKLLESGVVKLTN